MLTFMVLSNSQYIGKFTTFSVQQRELAAFTVVLIESNDKFILTVEHS